MVSGFGCAMGKWDSQAYFLHFFLQIFVIFDDFLKGSVPKVPRRNGIPENDPHWNFILPFAISL